MGAQGTAIVDFGAFPGKSDASVAVTGQGAIVAGSLVEAWIRPVDTVDHLADEHMVETLKVFAHTIVAGVGFTISLFNASQQNEPLFIFGAHIPGVQSSSASTRSLAEGGGTNPVAGEGGQGTRIYGQWTVAWVWN